MATRPVFLSQTVYPYVQRIDVDFLYCSGFSMQQRKRCVANLHEKWNEIRNEAVLEVSSASDSPLGNRLSAFQLPIIFTDGRRSYVECLFQGSKCFEHGGPYQDLYFKSPKEAKQDPRLKESGKLECFIAGGHKYPLSPSTYFYDWIYINALAGCPHLHEEILLYEAFTDIMFNPAKQINCQAEAVAIFAGLKRNGRLENALKSRENFLAEVFHEEERGT